MKAGSGSDVVVLPVAAKIHQAAAIRRGRMRWANLTTGMVTTDDAMSYVADVIEAEVIHLGASLPDLESVIVQLIDVVAYLRQQSSALRK